MVGMKKIYYINCNIENIAKESISQEFRWKDIYETRNYFIEEVNQNQPMSKKYKKFVRL